MSARRIVPLSEGARQRLPLVFAPEDRRPAQQLLENECGAGIGDFGDAPAAYDRVRFAAMKASHGRLEGLRRAVAMARTDWRDLLVEAGFADDATAYERWMVPGSTEAARALQRWESPHPLSSSALRFVAGMTIAPPQRHEAILRFTIHGVPAHEFVQALLSALSAGEEVALSDPEDDCGRYVRAVPGGWQTKLVCHGRLGDVWHDASREQAFAWLMPAAQSMVANPRIEGWIAREPDHNQDS